MKEQTKSGPVLAMFFCLLFLFVFLPSNGQPENASKSLDRIFSPDFRTGSLNDHYSRLTHAQTEYDARVQHILNDKVQLKAIKQKIKNEVTPERLAEKFVQEFRKSSHEKSLAETKNYLNECLKKNKYQDVGAIAGSLFVPTEYLRKNVTVLAFDNFGYIVGIGETNIYRLTYKIENLPPGEYYILTVSDQYAYVDEIYNNIAAPLFSRQAWREADKVTVTADAITENINFELQPSAEFLLILYRDSTTVSTDDEAIITLMDYNRSEKVMEGFYEYNYNDGQFEFFVPFLGDFKLGVTPANKPTTWYKSSNTWAGADKLSIPEFPQKVDTLDIILNREGDTSQYGKISGMITGNGVIKMIFAFKAEDLSLANIALIFYSSYQIEDLEPGEYYVYAEDYLGHLKNANDLLGTFYNQAAHLSDAEKVVVEEGQNTYGINIALREGAAITGKITDNDGNPLIDMLIVALNMSFPQASAFNLFTQMHFGVGASDSSGIYKITGLAQGEYILRTLSDYAFTLFWGFPTLDEGPYKGKVVDEFYPGIHNLFEFAKAEKIAVQGTETVENIDLQLEKAKYFRGQLTLAPASELVDKALMVALVDSSGFPFYAIPQIDRYGAYELGPFPNGTYKILAAADHNNKEFYLAEFYKDATTFDGADAIQLADNDVENIDFEFDKAAVIQGHVDMAPGTAFESAGEDTLYNFPVVLYNATDGSFERNAYVQFDGGFRIARLLPGEYKLAALPMASPFAGTYYGGGDYFDDPASQVIQITAGEVLELDIELEPASGAITGVVTSKTTGEPVINCLVIAYDPSGHAIAVSVTDASANDIVIQPATGKYQLTGLRNADYYLCTYAFTDESEIAIKVPQYLMAKDNDLFDMVFGLLEALFATDLNLYRDSWYDEVPLRTEFDIPELVRSFIIYGMANEYDHARYPFYMPIPFQRAIPQAATAVTVSGNSTVQHIDFRLDVDNMKDIFLDVEKDRDAGIANEFTLLSNYPNPFNTSTKLCVKVSQQSRINLSIYNIRGEKVIHLAENAFLQPGVHELEWNGVNSTGNSAPTGLYFAVLETGTTRRIVKLTLLR